MAGITGATFWVHGVDGIYRVMIKTMFGSNPVGHRLLRNGFISEKFVQSDYPTQELAYESRDEWEKYYTKHIGNPTKIERRR